MSSTKDAQEQAQKALEIQQERMVQSLPADMQKKFLDVKKKVDELSVLVQKEFQEYVVAVALLPPDQKKDEKGNISFDTEKINALVVIDDADSNRFPREDFQDQCDQVIQAIGKKVDAKLEAHCSLLSLLWQSCLDGKFELVQKIGLALPVYDSQGVLAALKLAEVHKRMVLGKFERYIVSYVLAGSLIRKEATPTSDIDVWIVIDDTDVKKMTRLQLKERLRGIILQMGLEAGESLGIRNKLNIQVYILTDFWDSLKEANPIIFTLLRDGVPLFDRGMFMPWKQLLKLGKIKPSNEAINLFMSSGQEALKRTHQSLKAIGMEDMYYAMLTPTQSALMLYGVPPVAPKNTPELFRDIFVKKEKLIEEKYVKMLEHVIKVRKDLEHGDKKEITGKEIDELLSQAKDFLARIDKLFETLDKRKNADDTTQVIELAINTAKEALEAAHAPSVEERELVDTMEKHLVQTNLIPKQCVRTLSEILNAKQSKVLSNEALAKLKKQHRIYMRILLEFIQRKRARDLHRAKIRVKHGDSFGELIMLDTVAFIVDNVEKEKPTIQKAAIGEDGTLGKIEASSYEELEKVLTTEKLPKEVFVRQPIFTDLQKAFGKNVEIVL